MSAVTAWGSGHPGPITGEVRITLAFDDFYQSSRDGIARILAVTVGDRDLAAEAIDEAMVRAFQRWERVGQLDNPGGWVYRVGLNWATSRLRSLSRSRRRHHEPPYAEQPPVGDPLIARALSELSIDHRTVVVCRYLLGWSESRTAEALGLRPGTVKSRLARATKHLQHRLHSLDEHEQEAQR